MQCPSCPEKLSVMTYEGVDIQTCDGCGGEFIGSAQIAHIVRTREERFPIAMQAQLAERKPSFGIPAGETHRTLDCPSCCTTMSVINYYGDTGVFVDRCESCGGLWLDGGELEKVQILLERWADEAPEQLKQIAHRLQKAKEETAERTGNAFEGSRFAFVNAIINRMLDAA